MYKPTIGLEIHVELSTISKCFSSGRNEYNSSPNEGLNVVDLGFPGILPVLNKEAVRRAIMVSLGLNLDIAHELKFDRKNYFYPDLPKGYQITQSERPVGINGYLDIFVNNDIKRILIHDLHLEEDTASLDHFKNYSLINYNRAGVPLIEIVTEPCMHSKEEAICFLESLRSLIVYSGASTARSDRGQIRCDVNVSISEDDSLGTKVEVKNINSFYNVEKVIEYEIKRQTEVLENKEVILQETRRLDSTDMKTYTMRSKEDAIDYKYYSESNIPVIKIEEEYVKSIKNSLPIFAFERTKKYLELGINKIDADTLVKDKGISDYFEECLKLNCNPRSAVNWICTRILGIVNKENISIDEIYITPSILSELISLIDKCEITTQQGKEIFEYLLKEKISIKEIISKYNIVPNNNEDEEENFINEVLESSQKEIEAYQNGRTNMLDYLVGQVMKKSKGRANPSKVHDKILERIKK